MPSSGKLVSLENSEHQYSKFSSDGSRCGCERQLAAGSEKQVAAALSSHRCSSPARRGETDGAARS